MYQVTCPKAPIRDFKEKNVEFIITKFNRFHPVGKTYAEIRELLESGEEVNFQGVAIVKLINA